MKSQAVFVEGAGIPGVSGDEKVNRPATPGAIRPGAAKLAGLVPAPVEDAFPPNGGSEKGNSAKSAVELPPDRGVAMERIPLGAVRCLYPSRAGWNCNEFRLGVRRSRKTKSGSHS
jgi:hypothetical protein